MTTRLAWAIVLLVALPCLICWTVVACVAFPLLLLFVAIPCGLAWLFRLVKL